LGRVAGRVAVTETTADPFHSWLVQTGCDRTVVGYSETTELLSDPRMHADFMIGRSPATSSRVPSLLSLNGDDHKRLRSLIAGRFTPRSVNVIRPAAHQAAHELIHGFAPAGGCELIGEFAAPYVAITTCTFLGIASEEVDEVASRARALDAPSGLIGYARAALSARQNRPTDDILSTIAEHVNLGALTDLMAVGLVAGLLTAGHGPTINQLGIMVDVLSREPHIWDAVGQGTVDPVPVVEEVLRFRPTNQATDRRVGEPFEYRGLDLVEGERLRFRLAAANHDPRHFANADHFDLQANRGSHLAFGFGPHFCLGAALARAQLQEALRALTSHIGCPQVRRSVGQEEIANVLDQAKPPRSDRLVGPAILDIEFTTGLGPRDKRSNPIRVSPRAR
jgi:cytochrome P450